MHSASNGYCTTREVRTGADNHLLTPDELRDEAMGTALSHIHIIRDILAVPDEDYIE